MWTKWIHEQRLVKYTRIIDVRRRGPNQLTLFKNMVEEIRRNRIQSISVTKTHRKISANES